MKIIVKIRPMVKIPKVFISYSNQDKNFVKRLTRDLNGFRIEVWSYEEKIKVGDSIPDKVGEGLIENQFFAIVLSNNSIKSSWVKKELNSAMMMECDEKKIHILPILKEDCEIPPLIKEKAYADFTNNYVKGLSQLLEVLVPDVWHDVKQAIKDELDEQKQTHPEIPDNVIRTSKFAIDTSTSYSFGTTLHTISSLLSSASGSETSPGDFLHHFIKVADKPLIKEYFDQQRWKCRECGTANYDPYPYCYKCGSLKGKT